MIQEVGAPSRRGTPIRRILGAEIGTAAYAPVSPWGGPGGSPSRQITSLIASPQIYRPLP